MKKTKEFMTFGAIEEILKEVSGDLDRAREDENVITTTT